MIYYPKSRLDGLWKRSSTDDTLIEEYLDREDFLSYRKIDLPRRAIEERFDREMSKKANDQVETLIYALESNRFDLIYHRDEEHISASTRSFDVSLQSMENRREIVSLGPWRKPWMLNVLTTRTKQMNRVYLFRPMIFIAFVDH